MAWGGRVFWGGGALLGFLRQKISKFFPISLKEYLCFCTYSRSIYKKRCQIGTFVELDYDINYDKLDYLSGDPRSIGNYLNKIYSDYGFLDNSNEINDYSSNYYSPVNPPLDLDSYGNPDVIDPNRWQPLKISNFIDQSGNLNKLLNK